MYTLTAGVRDDNGESPLDVALDEGSVDNGDVGLYLIKHHGCGDEQDKAKLLCKACKWGNLDVVKELVEQHNVDPNGECMLHVICFDLYCSLQIGCQKSIIIVRAVVCKKKISLLTEVQCASTNTRLASDM